MLTIEFHHLDWLSQFYSEWRQNFKISQFEDFCYVPGIWFRSKFENDKNFFILFYSSKKYLWIKFTFQFNHFDRFSQLYSEWGQTSKLVNLKISAKIRVCILGQNLKITKTS